MLTYPSDSFHAARLVSAYVRGGVGEVLMPLGEGDHTFAFQTAGRVVRVAKHADAAAALRREACAMAVVADWLPVTVPRPVHRHPEGGPAYSVHAAVEGEALTREAWEDLLDAARASIAGQLAEALHALHAVPPMAVAACGLPVVDGVAMAAGVRVGLSELGAVLGASAARGLDRVLAEVGTWAGGPAVVLHRDVAPGHVLWDPRSRRLTGLIDFGDLAVGPPARDYVYVYEDFGEPMLAEVLRQHPGGLARPTVRAVLGWFLLEATAWMREAVCEGRAADAARGLEAIRRAIRDMDRV